MVSQVIDHPFPQPVPQSGPAKLRNYYFARAAFSTAWVAAAYTIGASVPAAAAVLLVAYPHGTRRRTGSMQPGMAGWRTIEPRLSTWR